MSPFVDDSSRSSSPDLLALPVDDATSSPARPSKRVNLGTPRRGPRWSSGNGFKIQEFYVNTPPPESYSQRSSPTRSLAQTEDLISPWRIRVRVDAEHEDGQNGKRRSGNFASPKKRSRNPASLSPKKLFGADTQTSTVPLKDGEDEAPKRGRGRPRKSDGPLATRPPTPNPNAIRRRSSGGNQAGVEQTSAGTTPMTRKYRRSKGSAKQKDMTDEAYASLNKTTTASGNSTTKKGRRGRRKTLGPIEIATDPDLGLAQDGVPSTAYDLDEDEDRSTAITGRSKSRKPLQERSSVSPQKGDRDPRRASSTKMSLLDPTDVHDEFDSIMESEEFSMITLGSLPSVQQLSARVQDSPESTNEDRSPPSSKQSQPADDSPEEEEESVHELELPDSHPTNELAQTEATAPQPTPSLLSRTTQLFGFFKKTPTQPTTSPLPPRAPEAQPSSSPRALELQSHETPKLVRVSRAGAALQGVLDTEKPYSHSSRVAGSDSTRRDARELSPKERLDDLFSGFGSSGRRELRAGLRLGEELARRQMLSDKAPEDPSAVPVLDDDDDVFSDRSESHENRPSPPAQPYTLTVPKLPPTSTGPKLTSIDPQPANEGVHHQNESAQNNNQRRFGQATADMQFVPMPTPEDSLDRHEVDEMSWRHDTPNVLGRATSRRSSMTPKRKAPSAFLDRSPHSAEEAERAEESEVERQREPEALRKQFDEAEDEESEVEWQQEPEAIRNQFDEAEDEESEVEWQREPEAQGNQIDEAEDEEVVVVNSDDPTPSALRDEDSDEEMQDDIGEIPDVDIYSDDDSSDGNADNMQESEDEIAPDETVDVWQLEAQSSLNQPSTADFAPPTYADPSHESDRTKPPRSKLPTPWRSQNDKKIIYSDDLDQESPVRKEDRSSQNLKRASQAPTIRDDVLDPETTSSEEDLRSERKHDRADRSPIAHRRGLISKPAATEEAERSNRTVERADPSPLALNDSSNRELLTPKEDQRRSLHHGPADQPSEARPNDPVSTQLGHEKPNSDRKHKRVDRSPIVRHNGSKSDSRAWEEESRSSHKHSRADQSPAARKRQKLTPPAELDNQNKRPVQAFQPVAYPTAVERRVRSRLLGEPPKRVPNRGVATERPEVPTRDAAPKTYTVPEDPDDSADETIESIEQPDRRPPPAINTATSEAASDIQPDLPAWSPSIPLPSANTVGNAFKAVQSFISSYQLPKLPTISRLSLPSFNTASASSTRIPPSTRSSRRPLPRRPARTQRVTQQAKPRNVFTRAPSVPPSSAQASPLTVHLPWTTTHFRHLDAIYSDGLANPSRYARLADLSSAGKLAGKAIRSFGWEKRLEGWECGVIDSFLRVLEEQGVEIHDLESEGQEEAQTIDDEEVARRLFGLWCGRVMRGRLLLHDETVGLWDQSLVRYRDRALRGQRAWREASKRGKGIWG